MNTWVNGVLSDRVDHRDRGLQYGDGLFETMRVTDGAIRLLDFHLERLAAGCERLKIVVPNLPRLRKELKGHAAPRSQAVLKLIVTRGVGTRGYRPSGRERSTRVICLYALSRKALQATEGLVRIRMCRTRLGSNAALAGLKTLNRLESVLARAEWTDAKIWEGLMRDADSHIVCGTMSNLFIRHKSRLITPLIDRCGIAGVMRRWVMAEAAAMQCRVVERRLRWEDLQGAQEAFMTNAVIGIVSAGTIHHGKLVLRLTEQRTADALRQRLELQ